MGERFRRKLTELASVVGGKLSQVPETPGVGDVGDLSRRSFPVELLADAVELGPESTSLDERTLDHRGDLEPDVPRLTVGLGPNDGVVDLGAELHRQLADANRLGHPEADGHRPTIVACSLVVEG